MPMAEAAEQVDYAATAFLILCASLVLLMTTPGLALFYGGMTRTKSVLNMMMMSFGAMGVVGIIYVLYGYSMSFGTENLAGVIANPFEKFGLAGTDAVINPFGYEGYGNIPELAFVGFQLTFAVITVALISGAVADRVKFSTWLVFAGLWVTFAYFPIAHMVWGGGLLSGAEDGLAAAVYGVTDGVANVAPIDFAGGTVVHINAGMAALVLALVVGSATRLRQGVDAPAQRPADDDRCRTAVGRLVRLQRRLRARGRRHGGPRLGQHDRRDLRGDDGVARRGEGPRRPRHLGRRCVRCRRRARRHHPRLRRAQPARLDRPRRRRRWPRPPSPSALKFRLGYDDSLDVVGVHLVAGLWGTIGAGLLATSTGLFYGGGIDQTVVQVLVALSTLVISGVVTLVIALALKATIGWRVTEDVEVAGIDQTEHAESAYDMNSRGGRMGVSGFGGHDDAVAESTSSKNLEGASS